MRRGRRPFCENSVSECGARQLPEVREADSLRGELGRGEGGAGDGGRRLIPFVSCCAVSGSGLIRLSLCVKGWGSGNAGDSVAHSSDSPMMELGYWRVEYWQRSREK